MQIGRIYGSNRHAAHPAHLYLTGLDKDGALYGECVKKNDGFQNYMVCNKTIVDLRSMRIVVNKHWRVYLDFGCAGSLSLQLY